MRSALRLSTTLLLVAAPLAAHAQQPTASDRTGFQDSWYWGVKGGMASFDPNGNGRVNANSIGGEWLITRNRGALYVSVDQAFFDDVAGVFDPTVQGSVRPVNVSDLRRYSAALMAFPIEIGNLRPYLGAGISVNVVQSADPQGTFVNQTSQTQVFNQVGELTSKVAALFIGGAQLNLGRAAVFGQASAMPTRNNFLLSGASHTFVFEGGIRFNLARAIDTLK